MFGPGDNQVHGDTLKPTDLSRTTFGMKTSKSATERVDTVNISRTEYENLKVSLTQMVESKENELRHKLNNITDDLNTKTIALNKMKRTLVNKLKDLESSLIETNNEYQRSLEVDAMLESSQEERGESQMAELMEHTRKLEKEIEDNQELLSEKVKETQDLKLELKKYERDLKSINKELEEALAKEKSCQLENQMKDYEAKEYGKNKDKLLQEIKNLQDKSIEKEQQHKKDIKKQKNDLESQIHKMQELESKHITERVELNEKLKKLEKDLKGKNTLIDDYKNKVKQYVDDINNLRIEIKTLNNSQTKAKKIEEAKNKVNDNDSVDSSEEAELINQQKAEIKELLKSNPTKATEDLYQLWDCCS